MTNTHYIGQVNNSDKVDRISPRLGYKVVALHFDKKGDLKVVPPHFIENEFDFSADSECRTNHKNFDNCSCGFYAYNNVPGVIDHWKNACGGYSNQVIVEVALSGDVVVAEKGYRASHQRIRRVVMPPCWNCEKNAGTTLLRHQQDFIVAGCDECVSSIKGLEGIISFNEFSEKYSPEGFAPVKVSSVKDFQTEALLLLMPEKTVNDVTDLIDKLVASGRLDLVDQIIGHANRSLNAEMGL